MLEKITGLIPSSAEFSANWMTFSLSAAILIGVHLALWYGKLDAGTYAEIVIFILMIYAGKSGVGDIASVIKTKYSKSEGNTNNASSNNRQEISG